VTPRCRGAGCAPWGQGVAAGCALRSLRRGRVRGRTWGRGGRAGRRRWPKAVPLGHCENEREAKTRARGGGDRRILLEIPEDSIVTR